MESPVLDTPTPAERPSRRRRRWPWITIGVIVGLLAAFSIVVAVGIRIAHWQESRPIPTFDSLAEHPDASLSGTVAYYDSQSGCIQLVSATGQPSKQLWCLPKEEPSTWVKDGKPAGPQLVWRDDGRLEVTMFRWASPAGEKTAPELRPGWQKIIDARSGAVEDVPAADVPASPNTTTEPTTSPRGERVTSTSDPSTGEVQVDLTDASGTTRTLLSAHGPGEYTYQFGPVFWAPDYEWIAAADDGRILVITPDEPSMTRVLRTGTGGGAGGGTAGPAFAVTSEDILTPSS